MPRIGNLVISGSLIISGSDGNTTVLGSGSKNEYNGDVIIKSGSLHVIGSGPSAQTNSYTPSSSWSATSGGTQTSGSAGITGSLSVTGSTQFIGDVDVDGCFTINCCESLYTGVVGQIIGESKSGSFTYEIIAFTQSYGDITSQLAAAAALGNGFIYLYSPFYDQYASFGYEGSNYNGTRTFLTASGAEVPNGTVVYVGQPGFTFAVTGATYPVEGDVCTPIAEFCCDGITLYGDTTISGGLDVTGPTNLHDGLIITGCIEMLCPGDETDSYYGYAGQVRDGYEKVTGSGDWTSFVQLSPTYGNVSAFVSQSAVDNGGKLELLNTSTGVSGQYQFVNSIFTGTITRVIVSGSFIPYNPPTNIVLGNENSVLPLADTLMGSGSSTPSTIATFCCDGVTFDVDVDISGGLGVTGSIEVTGSVTVNGCVEVITSASCDQVLFTGFDASFRSSFLSGSIWLTSLYVTTPPYGDITAEFESYANNNGGIVTLYNTETSEIIYVNYQSSYYNGFANVLQFTGAQQIFPDSTGYLAIGIDGTSPIGADVTITVPGECFSTVIICDEEVTINGDTTVSGSVTVTGSVAVTIPCPDTVGYDVLVKSAVEFSPNVWTTQMNFAPQYGNISSSLSASAAANGGKIRLVTSDLSTNILGDYISYSAYDVGSAIIITPVQPPILSPLILADAGYVTFPAPADKFYVNFPGGCVPGAQAIAVINDTDGVVLNSDVAVNKSLILGPNNEAFDNATSTIEEFQYVGYNGNVISSGSENVLFLDSKYGDVTEYIIANGPIDFYFYSPDYNEVTSINTAIYEFDGTNTVVHAYSRTGFDKYTGLSLVAGAYSKTLVEADTNVYLNSFNQSIVLGSYNLSQHPGTLLAGTGLTSSMDYGTVVGMNNVTSSNSLFIVGNGNQYIQSNAFEVTTNGSIIVPTTSSTSPSYSGSQGEMFFGDDGAGNYVIWAYLGGAWRSGSLS
jgi:cytoskeletal protein CcmA (bactofilin family)